MEHYYKGDNQEEVLCKERVPIAGLPPSYGWLEVTGTTRVRPVVGSLCKQLRQEKALVLSGCGPHTSKVVTLAEIIKRKHKHAVLTFQPGERVVKEFWEPKDESEGLDTLVVTRRLPTLHILLDISRENRQPRQDLFDAIWGDDHRKQNTRETRDRNKDIK